MNSPLMTDLCSSDPFEPLPQIRHRLDEHAGYVLVRSLKVRRYCLWLEDTPVAAGPGSHGELELVA